MKNKYVVIYEYINYREIDGDQEAKEKSIMIICDTEKEAFKIKNSLHDDNETFYMYITIRKYDSIIIQK